MFETRFIGQSFPAFSIEVERAKLHEFALAVGQDDPIYHSRQAAREAGYEDVQMLPTTPTQFEFWGNPGWMERLREIGLNTTRLLHAEQDFAYLGSIVPGDVLTAVTTVVDGKARRGLDMVTLETRYTNQRGEHVLTAQMKVVVRE
ncbi:MAG TPA: MaoC family dehydratase N-terminal domain-containing protein [Ktedonobacteraceae bacterium]